MKEFSHNRQPIRPDGRLSRAIDEMNAVLRGILERYLIERSRSSPSVSRALGMSEEWLYRILKGDRRITVDNLEAVVAEIGVGLDEFFADYLRAVNSPQLDAKSSESEDPVLLLRALRGDNAPSLGWIGQFRRDRVTPLRPGVSFPLHANVQRLDDAREFDRHAARVEAEAWLGRLQKRSQLRRLNVEETAHLCTALGVWSSVQRALGHPMLSVKALELAWDLHGEAPMAASFGDLLERTAVALHHFGYTSLGCPLIQRAFAVAALENDQPRKVRTHLGLAIFAFHGGDVRQAHQALSQILELPEADNLRIASATSFLARIEEREGRLEEAADLLNRLEPILASLPRYMQIALRCRQGRLLKSAGVLISARRIYEQLIASSQPLHGPVDRSVLLLHLTEVLAELEDLQALQNYESFIASLLEEMEDTPVARQVMSTLLLALRQGRELDASSIREMRRTLEGGESENDHPTGSRSG